MVKYEDGYLKLNFSNDILDTLWNVCFFLRMLSIICFGNINTLYYTSFFIFVGFSFAEFIIKRKLSLRVFIPLHTLWYGLFILLGVVSSIWADNLSMSFAPLSKLIQILTVAYCLITHIDTYERLESYINTVIAASLFLTAYIFVLTPPDVWFDGFLGGVTGYNTNDIGCALSIAVLFAYYMGFIKNRKIMYFICAVFLFAVILTSSRKSLFMSVFGIIMITVFNFNARNYVVRIMAIIALMILVLVLIYQIPLLYRTIGVRIDSMINYFLIDKRADSSIVLRKFYIDMAKQFYYENPVFGVGLNNFSYRVSLHNARGTYAHNNYCELAAGLGTVGLIFYYWFYVYLLIKLVKQVFNGHKTALLFMPSILLFLILEYGMVNYYKEQVHLVIAVAFVAVSLNDLVDREKHLNGAL